MVSQTTRLNSAYSNISHRKLNWIDTDSWSKTLHNHLFAQKPYLTKYLVEKYFVFLSTNIHVLINRKLTVLVISNYVTQCQKKRKAVGRKLRGRLNLIALRFDILHLIIILIRTIRNYSVNIGPESSITCKIGQLQKGS